MPCELIHDTPGRVTILCRGGSRPTCKFCHSRPCSKLCDFPVGQGKTCDAAMCAVCAKEVAFDTHHCPTHDPLPEAVKPPAA